MSNENFDYNYSALTESERMELDAVKSEYSPETKKQDALSRIRRLDKKVRFPAELTCYILGVAAVLMLGIGMCFSMEVLIIPAGMVIGCVIGIAGIILLSFNYKIYKLIVRARKQKYGKEILELTQKLLDGNKH